VFIRKFLQVAISSAASQAAITDLTLKLNALEDAINHVISDVCDDTSHTLGHIDNSRPSTRIFINYNRHPDGTSYGIVINGLGIAVNSLSSTQPELYVSKNVTIVDTCIKNIVGETLEVIALSSTSGGTGYGYGAQVDTAGSVFQILKVLNTNNKYCGNVLSNAQLSLARWSDSNLVGADSALVGLRQQGHFGTLNIHPAIVTWATPNLCYMVDSYKIDSDTPFQEVLKITGIKYIGNGDSMFHVNKGFFGVRLDRVQNANISVKIHCVRNKSKRGSCIPGGYSGNSCGGHPLQGDMVGYTGTDAYGVQLSSCENVTLSDGHINNIISASGDSYGVCMFGENDNIILQNLGICGILSSAEIASCFPNKPPIIVGVYVSKKSNNIKLCDTRVGTITSACAPYAAHKMIFDTDSVIIN
jgi:hypothetical protein